MGSIKSFTDLEIWKLATELTVLVYKLTKEFPRVEQHGLINQIRRSSSSVGANIAEGFGRYHYKEFIKFLYNSRGSLQETKHWMILSQQLGYVTTSIADEIVEMIDKINVKINNSINATEKQIRGKTKD